MIQPKEFIFPKDQRKQLVSRLFTPLFHNQNNDFLNDRINDLSPKRTLCLAIGALDDDNFITRLQKEADTGVRIYLLLGEEKDNKKAINRLAGRSLIRGGVSQAGGFLLQDGNTNNAQGWLISGKKIDRTLAVNGQFCEDLYRVFCHLFWQQASFECLEQNKPSSPVKNSPVGEIILNNQYNLPNRLNEILSSELESLQFGIAESWSEQMLWQLVPIDQANGKLLLFIPENEESKSLEGLCNIADVRLSIQPMGNLLCTSQSGWWLPDHPDPKIVNWALRFDQNQISRIKEYLKNKWQQADWQLQSNITIGDLEGQVRFANQPGKIFEIVEQLSITLDAVEAPDIDIFLYPNIEQLCADQTHFGKDRLAHTIEYSVKLYPPCLPSNAKSDLIETQWNNLQELWLEKLRSLKIRINELKKFGEKFSDRLKNKLSGFLLGQNQKLSEIEEQIKKLCAFDIGRSSPALLEQWEQELNELENKIKERESRCQQQAARTRKEIEWEDKCKKMDDDIKHLEDKVSKQEGILKNASKELERAKQLLSQDNYNSQLKKELEKSTNIEQNAQKSLAKTKQELLDFQSRRKKEENFIHPEDNLVDDAETFGKVLGNKPSDAKFDPEWPKEFLPAEGMDLYVCDQQRWLIIQDIEQLEEARNHANRLGAKIGIKREE